MAERKPALVTPFWVRIATETSLSPGWLLVAFPAVLYPTYLLLEALFGRGLAAATDFGDGGDFEARVLPWMAASFGYVAMMYTYVARGTFRDIDALRPVLRGGEAQYASLREQLIRFERRRLWIGALVGILVTLVLNEVMAGRWTRLLAGEWSLRDLYAAAIFIAFWIVTGSGAVYLIDSARVYSRIGERHVTVDLLDLTPSSPLTRHGLRIVLLIAISTLPGIVFFTVGVPQEPNPMPVVFTLCFWSALVAMIAFLLPVRGLRRQIRARKAEKLAQLRGEIRHNEELMAGSGNESAEAGAKMPGLLAYMEKIESVREWPFDAPTLTRFFLYVAIPLGSWVGGALVERLLGAALD
jgi:hypothetical protein